MTERKTAFFLATLFLSTFAFIFLAQTTFSAAVHIVISEVQIAGITSDDEFVELHNPTDTPIDVTGYRLTRTTSGGTESNLVASLNGIVPAKGYYLVVNPDYAGAVAADEIYSATTNALAANNTVTLYSDAGITIVDRVGMGTATVFESAAAPNPVAGESIKRTPVDEDTDDNSVDFLIATTPDPQNSSSIPASAIPSPTITGTPTSIPSATPDPVVSPTPSIDPTPAPTQTSAPTILPTAVSTSTPSSTPVSSPSPSPISTPLPTHRSFVRFARFGNRVCGVEYSLKRIGFMTVRFPRIVCNTSS